MTTPSVGLQGIAQTLLMPLACRAMESVREDAIIHDPHAVEVFEKLGGSDAFLFGVKGHDLFAAVMRVRQFDRFTRAFLTRHPGALVVDIGCGLDTRFDRLGDSQMHWLGIDLPEVISLRRQLLPDSEHCQSLAQSIFDLTWLDVVARFNLPVIFLAEGIIPYFTSHDFKPLFEALSARFPGGELVFDSLAPFMGWLNNLSSPILKQTGTRVRWDMKDPHQLEACGLRLIEQWGYFQNPEPRLGAMRLIRYLPPLARASYIAHFRLG